MMGPPMAGTSLSVGVDLVELERLRRALERHGERFLARVYTPEEAARFGRYLPELAARFAAKEAVSKALGVGMRLLSASGIGCTNMSKTQQGVASGVALGAIGGAGIAAIAGGSAAWGALAGAGVGAPGRRHDDGALPLAALRRRSGPARFSGTARFAGAPL